MTGILEGVLESEVFFGDGMVGIGPGGRGDCRWGDGGWRGLGG